MDKIRKPTHPGEFFKRTVLDEYDITITEAAEKLGITRKALSEFVNGKSRCSIVMAKRLSLFTGASIGVWMKMQFNVDVYEASLITLDLSVKRFWDE